MAIESVAGAEPTEQAGTPAPNGLPAGAASGAASSEAEAGAPYAIIDGKEFKDQAELTAWWDSGHGQDTGTAGADTTSASTETAAAGEDTLKGGQGEDAIPSDDVIRENLKKAGGIFADPKYEPFALEFEKSGGKMLPDESLAKAAEAFGVPVDAVKSFIEGQIAQRTLQAAGAGQPTQAMVDTAKAIVEVMPEEADYKALLAWGAEGLSDSERASYDAALNRGDTPTVKALLSSFQARFQASGQAKGPRDATREAAPQDGHVPASGATPYASSEQMQADMSKPEYERDPAFRAEVAARLAVSKF